MAALLAESTEVLACETSPKIGALLNASFGSGLSSASGTTTPWPNRNREGLDHRIHLDDFAAGCRAQPVLGRGLKNGIQHFDKEGCSMAAAVTLAVIGAHRIGWS